METENIWKKYSDVQRIEIESFAKDYMDFLSKSKTERECVQQAVSAAKAAGFADLNMQNALKAGDRVYVDHMGKSLVLFVIGRQPLNFGMNILVRISIHRELMSNLIHCTRTAI